MHKHSDEAKYNSSLLEAKDRQLVSEDRDHTKTKRIYQYQTF